MALGRARVGIACALIAAAVMLELALFLRWQNPPRLGGTSIFGSVDQEARIYDLLNRGRDAWFAWTWMAIVLEVIGLAALAAGVAMLVRNRASVALVGLAGVGGAFTATICAIQLASSYAHQSDYVLRGYGYSSTLGVYTSGRLDHGPGVILALVAGGVMLGAAIGPGAVMYRAGRRGGQASALGRT